MVLHWEIASDRLPLWRATCRVAPRRKSQGHRNPMELSELTCLLALDCGACDGELGDSAGHRRVMEPEHQRGDERARVGRLTSQVGSRLLWRATAGASRARLAASATDGVATLSASCAARAPVPGPMSRPGKLRHVPATADVGAIPFSVMRSESSEGFQAVIVPRSTGDSGHGSRGVRSAGCPSAHGCPY